MCSKCILWAYSFPRLGLLIIGMQLLIYRDPDYESVKNFSMSDVYDDILPSPVKSDSFDMSICPVYERQSSETTLSLISDDFEMTVSPLYSPADQPRGLATLPVMGAPADLARAFQIQPNTQHE